jgi:hypothetical protein
MRKQYKKQKEETQIIWKNMSHEAPFNPFRKYYAYAEIDGVQVVLDYVGKFLSEAIAALKEDARLNGGRLVSKVYAYKKIN